MGRKLLWLLNEPFCQFMMEATRAIIRLHQENIPSILYPWLKVHGHTSHTLLCSALFEICHMSLASMCSLGHVSQLLNWLTIPIYSNFSGASRHHCALPLPRHRSQQLLCTMCRVSHTRSLVHLYPWIQ